MRTLLYFSLIILLFACADDTSKDFSILKKNDSSANNVAPITSKKEDSVIYGENVSPDGSWEIFVNNQEGFFIGYTINYKDGSKSISKKLNSEIEIIGGIDNPGPKWINATTYQLPNIGGTAKGYYELLIYKDGSCKYIEHFANLEENSSEETEISTSDNNDKKKPQIENSYSQNENFIVFRQDIKDSGENCVGCSSSETSLSMVIQNVVDSFEFRNEGLSVVKLNYSYSGGLSDFTGEKPFKGFIKGKLLEDNTWKIEIDVWVTTFSYVENEKGKKQIKASGIFKP